MQSDMLAISPQAAQQLRVIVFDSLLKPLETVFHYAQGIRPEK
jgi:hypothetical protein